MIHQSNDNQDNGAQNIISKLLIFGTETKYMLNNVTECDNAPEWTIYT